MDRQGIFFTSDWHIGHENVIQYSSRPFKDIHHMSRVLINNYNSTVPPDGLCYFLGDMGLCKGDVLKKVINQLNGTKVLILGNHDKNSNTMQKLGFNVVLYGAQLYIANNIVTLNHCPLLGLYREDLSKMDNPRGTNWHGDNKNERFSTIDRGQFHLHGHVHSPNNGKSKRILGKQFDVGVDANNYRPVSISQIESWIAKYGK